MLGERGHDFRLLQRAQHTLCHGRAAPTYQAPLRACFLPPQVNRNYLLAGACMHPDACTCIHAAVMQSISTSSSFIPVT